MMQEALTTTAPQASTSNWKTRLGDLAFLLLGLIVITALFDYLRPLARPDALSLLETAREMLVNHNWVVPTLNNAIQLEYPPLFYWLTAFSFKLFGYNLFAARLWSAIFSALGMITLYLFGAWFEGRRFGRICGLIAGSSLLYLTLSTAAAPYLMGAVLLMVSLCSLFTASLSLNPRHQVWLIVLFWVSAAFNVLLLGIAGVLLPLLIAVAYLLLLKDYESMKGLFSARGLALFFLITLPWFIFATHQIPGFLSYFFCESITTNYLAHFHHAPQTLMLLFFSAFAALAPWFLLSNMAYSAASPDSWSHRFNKPLGDLILIWVSFTFIYLIGVAPNALFWISLLMPAFILGFAKAVYLLWDAIDESLFNNTRKLLLVSLGLLTAFFALVLNYTDLNLGFVHNPITEKILLALYGFLLIAGLAANYTLKKCTRLKPTALIFAFAGLIGTVSFVSALPTLRQDSLQPIVSYLQTHATPNDVLANYGTYYPELAFTLQKAPIIMVDWTQVPAYATKHQNISNWIVSSDFFWQTMQSNGRKLFLVVPTSAMPALQNTISSNHLQAVVTTPKAVLLTH